MSSSSLLPSRERFFLAADVLSHTLRLLSIEELLLCSSLCSHLHRLIDSDAVWRWRLMQARRIQAAFTRLDKHSDMEDDDEEEDAASRAAASSSSAASSTPSASELASILELCLRHYGSSQGQYSVKPMAILPAPASAAAASSPSVSVFHVKLLIFGNALANKVECRSFSIATDDEGRQAVAAVGAKGSGTAALNAFNATMGADSKIVVTPPASASPARLPCKQQYIALLRCSAHPRSRCHRLLSPSPSLPPPRPTPAWFSAQLAVVALHQQPFPALPVSPYPALHPLPLCRQCRASALAAVRDFYASCAAPQLADWPVDCLLRINECEFDVRLRQYEDEVAYVRMELRQEAGCGWTAVRAELSGTSGVYAINAATNVEWSGPLQPSPLQSHPPVLLLHQHPLYHFTRSVYRRDEYGCDACGSLHRRQPVWHCSHCQWDACEAAVEAAQRLSSQRQQQQQQREEEEKQEERQQGWHQLEKQHRLATASLEL